MDASKPRFFPTPDQWRAWLEKNHESAQEVIVGFYKRATGKPSITWPESVDQALCFGWIDGKRKSIDDERYMIRFTPRKPTSIWSAVNLKRVGELSASGAMRPAGVAAYERRRADKLAIYAYEQRSSAELPAAFQREFRKSKKAWAFFEAQPPWYRRTSTYWVVSAKREETKAKRFATLVAECEKGERIGPLSSSKRPAPTR